LKKAVCNVNVAEAAFHSPDQWGGIAVAPNGDVYVSDFRFHMILRLRSDGYVEHIAGGGDKACEYEPWKDKKESGYRDGTGRQALFKDPRGLSFDREGNLFVADRGNCSLRRIDTSGNVTTFYKANVTKGCQVDPDDVKTPEKWINFDYVVIDPQGRPVVGGSWVWPSRNIYSNIHRLYPDGRVEQLLSATKGYSNSGKLGVEYISGMAYLSNGTLLVADDYNNLLRALSGTRLSDWLGKQRDKGDEDIDGPASQASLRRPGSLSVSGDGTVFVAPASPRSSPVRKVDDKTRDVSTWLY
jgi:sugar lactone lactonase YvrE